MEWLQVSNILITGGAGFIGSHMADELCKKHKVWVLDNLQTGSVNNVNKSAIFLKKDINNPLTILDLKALKVKFDYIFHYAATVGVRRTEENPLGVMEDLEGMWNVLHFAIYNGVKKVLFSSSSEVYGENDNVLSEGSCLNANTPYACVKVACENLLKAYSSAFGLRITCLRFFNVYGPRQDGSDYGFVTSIFINQLLDNNPLTIHGKGDSTRDFVYVKDNVQATILAMESKKTDGKVINIGTGKRITIKELANKLIKVSGKKSKIVYIKPKNSFIKHRCPNTSMMKKLLGFKTKYSLEDGLKETWDYYKNLNTNYNAS